MNRDDIEKKAVEYTNTLNLQTDKDLTLVHMGFKHGALCMQEQCHKDLLELVPKSKDSMCKI